MKRLAPVVMLVLLALSVVAAPAAHADDDTPRSWRIQRYEPAVTFDRDGTATVVLDLWFDFANDAGRGPYLWLPLRQEVRDNPDVWRMLDTTLVSVSSDTGASTEVAEDTEDGNLVVRVGSANRRDRTGVQHYRITYTTRGLVEPGAASGLDEVNWNAVGLGWVVPMDAVKVTVAGPAAAQRVACFAGTAFDQPCGAQLADPATFTAGPLGKGEGVQVVAGYPAGTFVGAEPRFEKRFHAGNLFPLTPVSGGLTAAVAGLGAVALMLARRRRADEQYVGVAPGTTPLAGQDARVGRAASSTVAVQFTPPKGVTPGEVGTLADGSADSVDVSATLVDLAVRGHLRITEVGDKEWRFDRLGAADPVTVPERNLLDSLFKHGPSTRSDAIEADTYYPMFAGTRGALDKRVTKDLKWFSGTPSSSRAGAIVAGVALILAGLIGGLVLAFAAGLGIVGLALVGLGVAVILMRNQFLRRTPDGTAVLAQARGFELYLRTAEADQIRFEEGIDVFSRYLPYAMVFGVAERWAKIFQQLAERGLYQPTAGWYVGPTGFYSPAFAHSIGNLGSDLGASMAASAAPSGGSGGGSGFSGGGGFGGGGGGGW